MTDSLVAVTPSGNISMFGFIVSDISGKKVTAPAALCHMPWMYGIPNVLNP